VTFDHLFTTEEIQGIATFETTATDFWQLGEAKKQELHVLHGTIIVDFSSPR
jgi:hypothetical protein